MYLCASIYKETQPISYVSITLHRCIISLIRIATRTHVGHLVKE